LRWWNVMVECDGDGVVMVMVMVMVYCNGSGLPPRPPSASTPPKEGNSPLRRGACLQAGGVVDPEQKNPVQPGFFINKKSVKNLPFPSNHLQARILYYSELLQFHR
jgi:hypothetical protein